MGRLEGQVEITASEGEIVRAVVAAAATTKAWVLLHQGLEVQLLHQAARNRKRRNERSHAA